MKSHNSKNLKSGFTLVEILVVTSIISLLSSITLSSVTEAKAKAQDSSRIQSVRQINTAINLYLTDKGHVPLLGNQCGRDKFNDTVKNPNCIALQTAKSGADASNAWENLKIELAPYMAKLPTDPCGFECLDGLGYTYVSPAGIYYECASDSSLCNKSDVDESSYQIYAKLSRSATPFGFSTIGPFFAPDNNTSGPPSY